MRGLLGWLDDQLPVVVLPILPGVGEVGLALTRGEPTDQLLPGLAAAGLCLTICVGVLLGTGAASGTDVWTVSLGALRRRRLSLQRLSAQLSADADRAAVVTSRLLSELVRAEESARALLAAELHDTVAQSLTVALMGLGTGRELSHLEATESVRDAEEQLRAVLAKMRPPELSRGTLAEAVADLCGDLDRRYGTAVDVSWTSTAVNVPMPIAVLIYRFVQEMLLNAVAHADGEGVSLVLDLADDNGEPRLTVTVADRGPGFDLSAVSSTGGRHLGLKLAGDRARLAGGELEIVTAVGCGTRVLLTVPLGPQLPLAGRPPHLAG